MDVVIYQSIWNYNKDIKFEFYVLRSFLSLPSVDEEGKKWAADRFQYLKDNISDTELDTPEKQEKALVEITKAYAGNPLDQKHWPSLREAIKAGLLEFGNGAKEYDSFTINCFFRTQTGREIPTEEEHYAFMKRVLSKKFTRKDLQFFSDVRKEFHGLNIRVLHDMGLDPFNDDYLAIMLLLQSFPFLLV